MICAFLPPPRWLGPGHWETQTPGQRDNVRAFHSPPPCLCILFIPPVHGFHSYPPGYWNTGTQGCGDTRLLGHKDAGTPGRLDTRTLKHWNTGTPGHRCSWTQGHWDSGTMGWDSHLQHPCCDFQGCLHFWGLMWVLKQIANCTIVARVKNFTRGCKFQLASLG